MLILYHKKLGSEIVEINKQKEESPYLKENFQALMHTLSKKKVSNLKWLKPLVAGIRDIPIKNLAEIYR